MYEENKTTQWIIGLSIYCPLKVQLFQQFNPVANLPLGQELFLARIVLLVHTSLFADPASQGLIALGMGRYFGMALCLNIALEFFILSFPSDLATALGPGE
jgi:hypothetical protein